MQCSKFKWVFNETTRLIGLPKAILYMSCDERDDMDVFVILRKLDTAGKELLALNVPWSRAKVKKIDDIPAKDMSDLILYPGPVGMLRASHCEIDRTRSIHPQYPFHPPVRELKVPKGEVVELEIGIWAMGTEYEAGEALEVQVLGGLPTIAAFGPLQDAPKNADNKGLHKVHFGGEYPSRVILPFT